MWKFSSRMLLDLPDEVLFSIFILLDLESIKTLFKVPELKGKLKNFICIVSDLDKKNACNWVPSCDYFDLKQLEVGDVKTWSICYLLHDLTRSALVEKICENKSTFSTITLVNKKIRGIDLDPEDEHPVSDSEGDGSLYDDEGAGFDGFHASLADRLNESANAKELIKRCSSSRYLRSIDFRFLQRLSLYELELSPSKMKLPALKTLLLKDCTTTNQTQKFELPKIAELTLIGRCKEILNSFDLEAYPDRTFRLSPSDITSVQNLIVGKAKFVDISIENPVNAGFNSIINLEMTAAETLVLNDISIVDNISTPNLNGLNLGFTDRSEIQFSNFVAVDLDFLRLTNVIIRSFSGLNSPKVTQFHANDSIITSREVFFKNLKIFSNTGSEGCFQVIDQGALTTVDIEAITEQSVQDLKDLKFPELRDMTITVGTDTFELPKFIAPRLQSLVLLDPRSVSCFKNLTNGFPNLTQLEIDYPSFGLMENITLETVQRLNLYLNNIPHFQIKNCFFPNLEEFYIYTDVGFSGERVQGALDFSAPKLELFENHELTIGDLDLSGFPLLKEISLSRVERLNLGDVSESLEVITFEGDALRKVAFNKEPQQLRYFEFNETPEEHGEIFERFNGYVTMNNKN